MPSSNDSASRALLAQLPRAVLVEIALEEVVVGSGPHDRELVSVWLGFGNGKGLRVRGASHGAGLVLQTSRPEDYSMAEHGHVEVRPAVGRLGLTAGTVSGVVEFVSDEPGDEILRGIAWSVDEGPLVAAGCFYDSLLVGTADHILEEAALSHRPLRAQAIG